MRKFITCWLPVIIWAGMIFYASSMPYQEQDLRPDISRYLNMDTVTSLFSWVSFHYSVENISIQALGPAGFVEFFIRKAAHFTVYFVLAFLLFRAFSRSTRIGRGKMFWLSFFLAGLYAVSDEFHQSFTAGRTPLPLDVGLDSFSAWIGTIIAFLIDRRFHSRKSTSIDMSGLR